jgi:hypothetical protein
MPTPSSSSSSSSASSSSASSSSSHPAPQRCARPSQQPTPRPSEAKARDGLFSRSRERRAAAALLLTEGTGARRVPGQLRVRRYLFYRMRTAPRLTSRLPRRGGRGESRVFLGRRRHLHLLFRACCSSRDTCPRSSSAAAAASSRVVARCGACARMERPGCGCCVAE